MPPSEKKSEHNVLVRNIIVAAGSSFANYIADIVVYPLDTINTWIKTSSRKDKIIRLTKKHIRKDGAGVLFRGINTQIYTGFFPSFVYFFCYEMSNRLCSKFLRYMHMEKYSVFIPTVTATLSECTSLLIMVPMDALKTRLQLNSPLYQYPSIFAGLKEIVSKEGYLRLFKASPLFIFHALVFNTILFQSYELFRIRQMKQTGKKNEDLTFKDSLWNTLYATVIAMSRTNPLDLIITRYQVIDSSMGKLSFRKVVKDVYKTDGWRGLNRGVWFRTFYGCLEASLYLPVYEELRKRYGFDFSNE